MSKKKTRRKAPKHYRYTIQPWDAIKAWSLCFFAGNVIKYVVRAGRKDGNTRLEDLLKARDYLEELIRDAS